jgi:hypothetical protein
MRSESRGILSPVRLPVPPLQRLEQEKYNSRGSHLSSALMNTHYANYRNVERRSRNTAKLRVFNGILASLRSRMLYSGAREPK